ncbi:MAG TPA: nuclease [Blastocatellia bacterium]|nr:nuclease [Blastocatellia bacterium]
MSCQRLLGVSFVLILSLLFISPPSTSAWGDEGHRYVNLVAAEKLPTDMPAFFRNAAARLSFLGPEPDRWRDNREVFSALREVNSPDHFINIDKRENFEALPNDRYRYAEWLRAQGKNAKDIGFLPYAILEGYQKIQVLFRLWRDPAHAAEREQIGQNIIFYAGVLGHYVADGAQPLHTSIHYNGWSTSANPEMFTREPLHWRFEGEYVKARIRPEDFSPLVSPARKLQDPFADTMKFLFDSFGQVEELYRMDKTNRWEPGNASPEAKQFVAKRLAAGSQMLANLWYTAYVNSGDGKP